ncbi:MAG TPA: sigma-70 family RNA polymerase sigma factor [Allocoleopsis sp.]
MKKKIKTSKAPAVELEVMQLTETKEKLAASEQNDYGKTKIDDGVKSFFKEMTRYPLLAPSEEIELSRQVKLLIKVTECEKKLQDELQRKPSLQELAERLKLTEQELTNIQVEGQLAKSKMINSNLRLVVSIAKRYTYFDTSFLDLIQEGTLGLNRAVEKFDPDKGYKFSTYAYWWIRQAMTRIMPNDNRVVRLPLHIIEKLNKVKKIQKEIRHKYHRNATEKEAADALGITVEKLRSILHLRGKAVSLNSIVGSEENTEFLDLLEDTSNKSPETLVSETMRQNEIIQVLSEVLTAREKDIIMLRYGLNIPQPYTLVELAELYNISRERVSQIQNKAMNKLRQPQVAKRLKGWL